MAHLLEIKLKLDAKGYKAEAGSAIESTKELAGTASVSFGDIKAKAASVAFGFNQIKTAVQTVGAAVAMLTTPFVTSQAQVAEWASLGVSNVDKLNVSVQDMAHDVSVGLDSLRAGMYEVISATVDTAHQAEVLELSAKTAKAGLTETNETLKLGSAIIKGYGKEWSEFESVMDMAIATVQQGQTTLPELNASIGVAVPLAAAMKIEMKELFGVMATGTGVLGSASEVATQLRAILAGLADPTKQLTALVQKQGYDTVEAAAANEGFAGIMEMLGEATGGSAAEMSKYFGRVEAMNAAIAYSTSLHDALIKKTGLMAESAGNMKDAFAVQNETIEAQIQILENRWTVIMEKAVAIAVPLANNVLDVASAVMDTRSEMKKLTDELDDLNSGMRRQNELTTLADRHDELKKKVKLTADEQEELKRITAELADVFPDAVTAVDSYGDALSINSVHIRAMIAQEQALLRIKEKDIFDQAEKNLNKYIINLTKAPREIARLSSAYLELKKTTSDAQEETLKQEKRLASQKGIVNSSRYAILDYKTDLDMWKRKLEEANEGIGSTISLLGNVKDFQNQDVISFYAKQFGWTADEVEILNQRIATYLKSLETAGAAPLPPGDTESTHTITTEPGVYDAAVYERSYAALEAKIAGFSQTVNTAMVPDQGTFTAAWDEQMGILDDYYNAGLIRDQQYNEQKTQLLNDYVTAAGKLYVEDQAAYRAAAFSKLAHEQAVADQRKALIRDVTNEWLGAAVALFGSGKAAATASAIVNTYQAATKALSAYPPPFSYAAMAATIVKGMAQVANIQKTKIEKRETGGPTLAGEPYLVGEKGAELFIPGVNGMIVSNRQLTTGFSSTAGSFVTKEDFQDFADRVVERIERLNIVVKGTLSGQEFLREEMPKYEKIESKRTSF